MDSFPSRQCSGCGKIHPGPFWDNNCPVVRNKKTDGPSTDIISFCSDLSIVLCKQQNPEEKIQQIKKLLGM